MSEQMSALEATACDDWEWAVGMRTAMGDVVTKTMHEIGVTHTVWFNGEHEDHNGCDYGYGALGPCDPDRYAVRSWLAMRADGLTRPMGQSAPTTEGV